MGGERGHGCGPAPGPEPGAAASRGHPGEAAPEPGADPVSDADSERPDDAR